MPRFEAGEWRQESKHVQSEWSSCCSGDKDTHSLLRKAQALTWAFSHSRLSELSIGSVRPISLQHSRSQLLHFIACKYGHMVISSLKFPCECASNQKLRLHYDTKTVGYPTVELVLICLLRATMGISLPNNHLKWWERYSRHAASKAAYYFLFHSLCITMHSISFMYLNILRSDAPSPLSITMEGPAMLGHESKLPEGPPTLLFKCK